MADFGMVASWSCPLSVGQALTRSGEVVSASLYRESRRVGWELTAAVLVRKLARCSASLALKIAFFGRFRMLQLKMVEKGVKTVEIM